MVLTSLIVLSLIVILANAHLNYHTDIGIPLANRIREAERAIVENSDYDINTRITHGADASIANYPWQAGLLIQLSPSTISFCGASLVSQNRLVTAGHCWVVYEMDENGNQNLMQGTSLEVVLGSDYLFYSGVRTKTNKVVLHPQWEANPDFSASDIAVIYLPHDIEFNDVISPVSLPFDFIDESFVGYYTIATGYGATHDEYRGGEIVNRVSNNSTLQYVGLIVLSNDECQSYFPGNINPWDLCTSGNNTVGTCQGDSGGPLVIYINDEPVLIGVTSRGPLDCEMSLPSIFTRVTQVLDFIKIHL